VYQVVFWVGLYYDGEAFEVGGDESGEVRDDGDGRELLDVDHFQCVEQRLESLMGELQGPLVDVCLALHVEEYLERSEDLHFLGVDFLLQANNDSPHEVEEMLSLPDASRDRFLQGVILQERMLEQLILTDAQVLEVKSLH
jgi:hypothetical protein